MTLNGGGMFTGQYVLSRFNRLNTLLSNWKRVLILDYRITDQFSSLFPGTAMLALLLIQ